MTSHDALTTLCQSSLRRPVLANCFPSASHNSQREKRSYPCSYNYLGVHVIMERAKGFEPSTPTLARSCSTPELHPRPNSGRTHGGGRTIEHLCQKGATFATISPAASSARAVPLVASELAVHEARGIRRRRCDTRYLRRHQTECRPSSDRHRHHDRKAPQ